MWQTIYKRFGVGLLLIVTGLLLIVPSALAGGWAVITLDELPAQVVAEQSVTIGFMVRQHGQRPMEGLTPQIKTINANTGESFLVAAKPKGKLGHYVAELAFPQTGTWDWSIQAFGMDQPMPALNVLSAAPITAEPATQSPSWPLLIGVAGLVGAAGTSLLWWRKRAWWAAVPVVTTLIVSGAGFASSANYTETVAPEGTSAVEVELGRDLFIAKGCIVCHDHRDLSEVRRGFADFRVGPDLPSLMTMSAEPALLHTWLKDPTAIKPDAQMPNLELKKTEIEALTAFLLSSKFSDDSAETTSADTPSSSVSSQ